MVLVGSLWVCGNWEFKVLSLRSPGGFNMINCLKHIYPWWIWLSHSNFVDMGVIIILGWCLDKIGSLGPFPGLAYLVKVFNNLLLARAQMMGRLLLEWRTQQALEFEKKAVHK